MTAATMTTARVIVESGRGGANARNLVADAGRDGGNESARIAKSKFSINISQKKLKNEYFPSFSPLSVGSMIVWVKKIKF